MIKPDKKTYNLLFSGKFMKKIGIKKLKLTYKDFIKKINSKNNFKIKKNNNIYKYLIGLDELILSYYL